MGCPARRAGARIERGVIGSKDAAGASRGTRGHGKDHALAPVGCGAVLERLYPPGGSTTPEELASGLRLGERGPADRPYLVVNMVSTLDGKATIDWRTQGLSDELDRALFHHLRTQADSVLVGAGTVRAERYGRMVKNDELREKRAGEGLERDALAVVVSARLDLPADLPLLQEPKQRVVTPPGPPPRLEGVAAQVEYLDTADDLPLLMSRLREQYGVRSILCEGGPTLHAPLFAAGLVDELFLTLSPKIVGGPAALTIVAGRELVDPAELELVWALKGGESMFTRWRLRH